MLRATRALLFCGISLTTCVAAPVLAQTASAGGAAEPTAVGEVVVTAQKRSERLQQVPIAVTAVTESGVASAQVLRSRDLVSLVPGMVQAVGSGPRQAYLRGIGINTSTPGQDSPVATYVDEVYIASPMASTLLLNSINRIEVLKGPQGTLFGRNAVAGVISYHSRNPTFSPGLSADIGYGSYDTVSAHLYGTAGIGEKLAVNLAVATEHQQAGWGRQDTLGGDFRTIRNTSVRGKLLWEPASDTHLLVTAWYDSSHTNQNVLGATPGVPGLGGFVNSHGPYDFQGNYPSFNKSEGKGASVRAEKDLGWAQLVDILAYQYVKPFIAIDQDASPADLQHLQQGWREETWTDELQLISASGPQDRFSWAAGVFLLKDDIPFRLSVGGSRIPAGQQLVSRLKTKSWAPFLQGTLRVASGTRLTAGIRYTSDQRDYSGAVGTNANPVQLLESTSSKFSAPTYRLSLDHDFSPNVMGYASYNRGFKAGTYNMGAVSNPPRPLRPEKLDAFEVGLKNTLFDRRAVLNFAGFYYNYRDVTVRAPLPNSTTFDLQNAATARLYGLDVDFSAQVTHDLNVYGGVELLHATFRRFDTTTAIAFLPAGGFQTITIDASGRTLPNAPKVSGDLGFNYRRELGGRSGTVSVGGNLVYRSTNYFEADNIRRQGPVALVNGVVKWISPSERGEISVWGRNLTDRRYKASQIGNVLADSVLYGEPRTVGVTVGVHLGSL